MEMMLEFNSFHILFHGPLIVLVASGNGDILCTISITSGFKLVDGLALVFLGSLVVSSGGTILPRPNC